jgi:hypothetical protein
VRQALGKGKVRLFLRRWFLLFLQKLLALGGGVRQTLFDGILFNISAVRFVQLGTHDLFLLIQLLQTRLNLSGTLGGVPIRLVVARG